MDNCFWIILLLVDVLVHVVQNDVADYNLLAIHPALESTDTLLQLEEQKTAVS